MDKKKILTLSEVSKFYTGTQTPPVAVAIAYGALPLYRLAATLLPTLCLLGKPPARLASSYDL